LENFVAGDFCLKNDAINSSVSAPAVSRTVEKLAASMVALPSANRQRRELAAKAKSAAPVQASVFMRICLAPNQNFRTLRQVKKT
jgi:hypothetical protein